jgi:hypothetical protein
MDFSKNSLIFARNVESLTNCLASFYKEIIHDKPSAYNYTNNLLFINEKPLINSDFFQNINFNSWKEICESISALFDE